MTFKKYLYLLTFLTISFISSTAFCGQTEVTLFGVNLDTTETEFTKKHPEATCQKHDFDMNFNEWKSVEANSVILEKLMKKYDVKDQSLSKKSGLTVTALNCTFKPSDSLDSTVFVRFFQDQVVLITRNYKKDYLSVDLGKVLVSLEKKLGVKGELRENSFGQHIHLFNLDSNSGVYVLATPPGDINGQKVPSMIMEIEYSNKKVQNYRKAMWESFIKNEKIDLNDGGV